MIPWSVMTRKTQENLVTGGENAAILTAPPVANDDDSVEGGGEDGDEDGNA